MALDGGCVNGRLLLLHGAPGTGKTTALRGRRGRPGLGRPVGRDATLAELYALKSGNPQLSHVPPEPAMGCYL